MVVETEFGFSAQENDFRIADVAIVSKERWEAVNPDGYFRGSPAVVIEVLSPSNTASGLLDKESLCLESSCQEFWVVDMGRRQVKVSTPDGHTTAYRSGQSIPLYFAAGEEFFLDALFG